MTSQVLALGHSHSDICVPSRGLAFSWRVWICSAADWCFGVQALKKFLAVHKHFEDFREDQFDFHGYCARKMTLRSYLQMLRMQDQLYHSIAFSKVRGRSDCCVPI